MMERFMAFKSQYFDIQNLTGPDHTVPNFGTETFLSQPKPQHQAFNLDYELTNYAREHNKAVLTGEMPEVAKVENAFKLNLKMFVAEYLSSMGEFQYEYYFNSNNQLQSEGWSKPAEQNYFAAMNEPNLDIFTQKTRTAEACSFHEIQELMRGIKNGSHLPAKAILQSPAENYSDSPYSFVSFYELEGDKVKVRNRKIYALPGAQGQTAGQHMIARNFWLDSFSKNNNAWQPYIAGGLDSLKSQDPINVLSSIVVLPNNANFDDLLRVYNQAKAIQADPEIEAKLRSFQPEMDNFFSLFTSKKEVDKELQDAFKILLIRAKVLLDENEANGRWGIEIVNQIKNGLTLDGNPIEAVMMALPLNISGSCGNLGFSSESISVGKAAVAEVISSLRTFSMPWDPQGTYDQLSHPDLVICDCGCKWYVKNGDPRTYKPCCPNPLCNKPQTCNRN